MDTSRITWSSDVGAADWIARRLGGPTGTVGSLMPTDFGAYACIPHKGDADAPPAEGSLPVDLARAICRSQPNSPPLRDDAGSAYGTGMVGCTPRTARLTCF